jgi:cytidylate kinase
MVITIDGSAGSGKSTVARKLAARLQIAYLDTGAMYRAVALAALQQGVDFADDGALLAVAKSIKIELECGTATCGGAAAPCGGADATFGGAASIPARRDGADASTRVYIDGKDVSESIRTMEVGVHLPFVARHSGIRALLIDEQRRLGQELGSFVSEGRDQGSVVFPDADAKFVLEATLGKRAERRHQELHASGAKVSMIDVENDLRRRDRVDAAQWHALVCSEAAIVIDTTDLTVEEVVDRMAAIVEPPAGGRPPLRGTQK